MAKAAQTYLTLGTESDFPKQKRHLNGGLLDESATQIRTAKGTYENRKDEIFRCNSQHFAAFRKKGKP